MGRSKKRNRTTGERHHVDGGVLPLLYPTSRLCTLHDLLLSLLLPSLQHPHAPASSSTATGVQLPPEIAGARLQVVGNDAEKTVGANVDTLQTAIVGNMGMRPAAASGHLCVKMQPNVATDVGVNLGMQQAAMPVNMGMNIFPQASLAVDKGAHQVQASKGAMYIGSCEAASTLLLKDMVTRQMPSGTDFIRQQTAAPADKYTIAAAHSILVSEGDPAEYLHLLFHGYGVLPDTAPPLGHTKLEQRWTHRQVIERAIQILFKQGKHNSNVLCFGFQQPRPKSCLKRERFAPAGLACVSDNAAVTVLNSQTWKTIHGRVH